MRILIFLCGFVAMTFAEIASSNKHHSQHEQSVNAAKHSLQERLSLIDGQSGYGGISQSRYGNAYGSSGSQKYVVGCSSPCIDGGSENRESYSSRLSSASERRSSSSNHAISDSDYNGVGIVGHSNHDEYDDNQSVVAPSYSGNAASSRYSSSNAFEADEMQQRVVPADLSSVSSSAYRSSLAENNEDDSQRTVDSGYGGQSSRTYSQTRGGSNLDTSRISSAAPVYVGSSQRSSSSQYESELNENSRKPIQTGQYVSIASRPGTATVLAVPVRVIQAQGVPEANSYSRASEHSSASESSSSRAVLPGSSTYRVTYVPSRSYTSADKIASSTYDSGVQHPEKFTNYNTFNPQESSSQTRFRADEIDSHSEQGQVRVAPVSVSYPHNGGSSRYASSGSSLAHQGITQSRVPVFPINTAESSSTSSLRTAEEREQRRYTPAIPTHISTSRISAADQEESRSRQSSSQYGGSNTYVVPVLGQSRSQIQQQSGSSGHQSQYQRQGGYAGTFSPYVPSRSQSSASQLASSDVVSQRFGSGVSHAHTDDLHTYMSESERLARLQQHQIAGTSSGSAISSSDANRRTLNTASSLDSAAANFVRSSNLASRTSDVDSSNVEGVGAGAGGYNRVRSWNKQSKWSSGSEYGTDGKPKSFSTLSTAEAEKYNINGNEAGYKAATTTLENDGKVSTYSIHTP